MNLGSSLLHQLFDMMKLHHSSKKSVELAHRVVLQLTKQMKFNI